MSEMVEMMINDALDSFDPLDSDYRMSQIFDKNPSWITMDGHIIEIRDMTDAHLENAINYSARRNKLSAVRLLTKEKIRRENRKKDDEFFNEVIKCQFCKKDMKRQVYVSDPNEGVGWGWKKYAFTCICGARGPLHDKP